MAFRENSAYVSCLLTVVIIFLAGNFYAILRSEDQFSVVDSARSKLLLIRGRCPNSNSAEFKCNSSSSITSTCPPSPPVQVVEKKVVVKQIVRDEPWYARGRLWHYPVRFPRCSMDACFNYSRCDNTQGDVRFFAYDGPGHPVWYFSLLNKTKWYTTDPEQACIFLVFLDTQNPHPVDLRELPHWNGGMNHVLVSFVNAWRRTRIHDQGSIGFASLLMTDLHETIYRPGFDISMTLPPHRRLTEFQHLLPFERKYLLTFRGVEYLGHDVGTLRSDASFREMHNGVDVIVAVSCKLSSISNDRVRQRFPTVGLHCDEDERIHAKYSYTDLMNSTFGLTPAGRQANSYRFAEVLSTGAIPVLIADNYVRPFDTLIHWHKCLLQFPTTEIRRIVPTLRRMSKEEVEKRQAYCLKVYNEYFRDDDALLKAGVDSLTARFLGVFPNLTPLTAV